ncbi:MAG: hypothetical protein PHW54_06255 [Candidatus Omnitrophica bacterium]|nr:hypothetical protein [Candidatus Omnitrophota bacterium]
MSVFVRRAGLFIWIGAVVYVLFELFFICKILIKYRFPDLKKIEPIHYAPDKEDFCVAGFSPGEKIPYTDTYGRRFYAHINALGARNIFEVSKKDKNLVVLLGDSFFFGAGLGDTETISYFLNQSDFKRRYINLSLIGNNVCDSVSRYFLKSSEINQPRLIIFQIFLKNDICASVMIEHQIKMQVEADYRYVMWPFTGFFSKNRIIQYALSQVYMRIYRDLSEIRFREYIQHPLEKLLAGVPRGKTGIIVIVYDVDYRIEKYALWLKQYCFQKNVYYFNACELLDNDALNDRTLDGHPGPRFNKVMAKQIRKIIDALSL